jgi:hypothetical protein
MRFADSLEVTAPDRPPALTLRLVKLDQLELRRRTAAVENEYSHSECSILSTLWYGRIK